MELLTRYPSDSILKLVMFRGLIGCFIMVWRSTVQLFSCRRPMHDLYIIKSNFILRDIQVQLALSTSMQQVVT